MHKGLAVLAVVALAACQKTGDNQYEVVRPGLVTDTVTTPSVNVGTTTDTVNVPVVGTKKVVVKRPTVDVKKP